MDFEKPTDKNRFNSVLSDFLIKFPSLDSIANNIYAIVFELQSNGIYDLNQSNNFFHSFIQSHLDKITDLIVDANEMQSVQAYLTIVAKLFKYGEFEAIPSIINKISPRLRNGSYLESIRRYASKCLSTQFSSIDEMVNQLPLIRNHCISKGFGDLGATNIITVLITYYMQRDLDSDDMNPSELRKLESMYEDLLTYVKFELTYDEAKITAKDIAEFTSN